MSRLQTQIHPCLRKKIDSFLHFSATASNKTNHAQAGQHHGKSFGFRYPLSGSTRIASWLLIGTSLLSSHANVFARRTLFASRQTLSITFFQHACKSKISSYNAGKRLRKRLLYGVSRIYGVSGFKTVSLPCYIKQGEVHEYSSHCG